MIVTESEIIELKHILSTDGATNKFVCEKLNREISWIYKVLNLDVGITYNTYHKILKFIREFRYEGFMRLVDMTTINEKQQLEFYNQKLSKFIGSPDFLKLNQQKKDSIINEQKEVYKFIQNKLKF